MSKLLPIALCLSAALAACTDSTMKSSAETPASESIEAVEAVASTPAPAEQAAPAAAASDRPAIPEDTEIVTLESGLKYSVLTKGEGTRTANVGDRISMHYTGWLLDGTMFDSSRTSGRPFSFTVGSGVIAGWSEAAQHMGLGDRLKLTIPPELGYGASGSPPVIPPGATLVFEVEMVDATFMPAYREGNPSAQTTLESGLVWEQLTEGAGSCAAEGDVVDLKYAIWGDTPASDEIGLLACDEMQGQTIKGVVGELPLDFMNEATVLLTVGARYRFIVPALLMPPPGPGAPPAADTVWELELTSISKPLPIPEFAMPTEAELTTTESGLAYRVDQAGEGTKVKLGQTVTVHYAGWLTDGTLFDASYKRGGPTDFPLQPGGLISGWIEGLQLMSQGAVYTFVIPAPMAYGAQVAAGGKIPANSTLVFEITLVAVQ